MNEDYGAGHAFGSPFAWSQPDVSRQGAHTARRPASGLAGLLGICASFKGDATGNRAAVNWNGIPLQSVVHLIGREACARYKAIMIRASQHDRGTIGGTQSKCSHYNCVEHWLQLIG